MPHVLIFGQTESGKTTLAKELARMYKARGVGVLVLDPMCDPQWQADYQTDDPDEFLQMVWSSERCAIFIDEAGQAVGRYDLSMIDTATKGRHYGHNCHYISQRGAMIAVTVRDQCSQLFLFTTSKNDSKIHANEWNSDVLLTANTLDQGEYYHVTRTSPAKRLNIF